MALSFSYFAYVIINVQIRTFSRFRFEYYRHQAYFFILFVGILIGMPLVLMDLVYWQISFDGYLSARWLFYLCFMAHSIPALICIFAKPNEDCFNCFNRLTPSQYSVYQYTI